MTEKAVAIRRDGPFGLGSFVVGAVQMIGFQGTAISRYPLPAFST
jgi:hypothetical protein